MRTLETKINGHKIESHEVSGQLFLNCNGSNIPAYHIRNLIRIIEIYENVFKPQDHVIKQKLFNLEVSYLEIKGIYDEIYK